MSSPHASPETILEYSSFRKHPIETFRISGVNGANVVNWVGACSVLAEEVAKERPDILFVPLRGASATRWVTEGFMHDNGSQPRVIELPIGTYTYLDSNDGRRSVRMSGMHYRDKFRIISDTLAQLHVDGGYVPNQTKVMLADEVQYGSTIVDASNALSRSLQASGESHPIGVFSMKDGRFASIRTGKYANFLRGANVKDLGTTVDKLFTVDSTSLLDGLFNLDPTVPPTIDTIKIVHNERSRFVLKKILELYKNPDGFDEVAEEIMLEDRKLTDLTPPPTIEDIRGINARVSADEGHIDEWLRMFARAVKKQTY